MLFLTGATGFLGGHFLYRLLGEGVSVATLARAEDAPAARRRVLESLDSVATSYRETPASTALARLEYVLRGDITLPECGVDAGFIAEARGNVPEFWHLAATVEFEDRKSAHIHTQNVVGVRNAVGLAHALGAKRFVYVSTAYTVGQVGGDVPENLHDDKRSFNNQYEQTKWEAERLVASACEEVGIEWAVVRPSIVIGPIATKRTGGSTTGLYGFLRELARLKDVLVASGEPLTIAADPETPLNLIPVDRVVEDMLQIRDASWSEIGRVHHLTSPAALLLRDAMPIACEVVGVPGIRMVSDYEPQTPLERVIARRLEFYRSYLRFPKQFERTRAAHPSLTREEFRSFSEELLREQRGEVADRFFQRTSITASDGSVLAAFEVGVAQKGTVVFANAFGMPAEFAMPLAKALKDRYRVLTWECRGAPNLNGPLSKENAGLDAHVQDLRALLDAFDVQGPVHLVGWCSGCAVAHRFARVAPERVASISLMNGSFFLPGAATTKFQDSVRQVMPQVAGGFAMANLFFQALFARRSEEQAVEQINHLLDGIHPSVLHLTSLPFQSAISLHRYALLVATSLEESEERFIGTVRAPALIIAGKRDQVSHHEGSLVAAKQWPSARLAVGDDGNHYSFFFETDVRAEVVGFIEQSSSV